MTPTPNPLAAFFCGLLLLFGGASHAPAQAASGSDPSDVFLQAWLNIRDAEKLEKPAKNPKTGKTPAAQPDAAYQKYLQALKLFQTIARYHPAWRKEIVQDRIASTRKSLERLQTQSLAEQRAKEKGTADIVTGDAIPQAPKPLPPLPPARPTVSPAAAKRVAELERQLTIEKARVRDLATDRNQTKGQLRIALANQKKLQAELDRLRQNKIPLPPASTPEESARLQRLSTRIAELENLLRQSRNDRDAAHAAKRRALAELKAERSRLAAAPVQAELDALNRKLQQVTQEKNALATALAHSKDKLDRAIATAAKLKTEHDTALAGRKDLQRRLEKERLASNEVIRGLRRQLADKQLVIDRQARLLVEARHREDEINRQLAEARSQISEIKAERDSILRERDQMTHLLNLNESNRVQQMINQNMALGKQVRQLHETIASLSRDNNSTKDQLIQARQDLAIAKQRILDLRQEEQGRRARLDQLRKKLLEAEAQIALDESSPDLDDTARAEITTLKGIIKRQLFAQELRHQKRTLILDQLARLSQQHPELADAIDALSRAEFTLTDEESRLLSKTTADASLRYDPGQVSAASRKRAAARLQADRRHIGSAAQRCYSAKRYRAARELYEMILDLSPGHIPTLLNLGTVHLRLQDYPNAEQAFQDAITLRVDQPLPYAHYMLGCVHYEKGEDQQAADEFRKALDLYPDNAPAHVFLGNLAGLGNPAEARDHFRKASEIDPTLTEPHYNLAVLALRRGNKEEALRHYRTLIEKGGKPDPDLEKQLGEKKNRRRRRKHLRPMKTLGHLFTGEGFDTPTDKRYCINLKSAVETNKHNLTHS